MKLQQGDKVAWYSMANGSTTKKAGQIVSVVGAGEQPNVGGLAKKMNARTAYGWGSPRGHESYIVSVPQGKTANARPVLYWPVVSRLEKVKG